jgi:spore germination protein GerM
MRRFWIVLAGLALTGLSTGCGVATDGSFDAFSDDEIPFGLADPATTTTTEPTTAPATTASPTTVVDPFIKVTLCFVRADRLLEVERRVPSRPSATEVIRLLLEGPATNPVEEALRSALPAESVGEVRVVGGVALLSVNPALRELVAKEQTLAIGQLVCTLTAQRGIGQVSFEIDGQPVEVPRADGTVTPLPMSRDDFTELLAP